MSVALHHGDCRDVLATLPAESVQCCVTSPPYFGLRDYGVDGQIGLEQSPQEYVEQLVAVFREVRRVLRKDGVAFLNLGDSYAQSEIRHRQGIGSNADRYTKQARGKWAEGVEQTGRKLNHGLKPKDLMMIPNRVAIALQEDGWWVRSEIIWSKAAPMPESVRDRPTSAHEKVWLLTKAASYFYDADAVAEKSVLPEGAVRRMGATEQSGTLRRDEDRHIACTGTRNLRNVWHLNPEPFPGAHFATMPATLAERCIKAGTSEKGCCPTCGAPWTRQIEVESRSNAPSCNGKYDGNGKHRTVSGGVTQDARKRTDLGWRPSCSCPAHEPVPQTVLDPFAGAGTTLLVADRLQRHAVGIELNPEYIALARRRLAEDAPLFSEVA